MRRKDLKRTTDDWIEEINTDWCKQVPIIIKTGEKLNAAKKALVHGEWQKVANSPRLPFDIRVAQMLMKIAKNDVLSKTSNHSFLPVAYNTLYHLSGFPLEDLQRMIDSGEVNPRMTLADAKSLPGRWNLSDNFGKTIAGLVLLMERQCPSPSDEEVDEFWYQCEQALGLGASSTKVREIVMPWLTNFFDREEARCAERTGLVDHGGWLGLKEHREIADPMADATA